MLTDARTPLILVAGMTATGSQAIADALLDEHTLVVQHDLSKLADGVVRRRVRHGGRDRATVHPLTHGCVSCALREELLPLLRTVAGGPQECRVVLHLDPVLEPETVCWAIDHLVVDGRTGVDGMRVQAVITVLDAARWLADATGSELLRTRGMAAWPGDGRSTAQLAVGQVEFADALVVAGAAPDVGTAQRTDAVLDRLAPIAPRARAAGLDVAALLAAVPSGSRRGRVDDAHAVLAPRDYPQYEEHGVGTVFFRARRPFHPGRLHTALAGLLSGVVRTRGRMWVATRPDEVLALESAGGVLRVTPAGCWLGAVADWSQIDVERALMASLRWDDRFEDREQALLVVFHAAAPEAITGALDAALVTDAELAVGEREWRTWSDPFGSFHTDPCSPSHRGYEEDAAEQDRDRRPGSR
ncbi:MAG TPA: GTP-binding protein [Pseudonocardiaceae bacterium]|nr:GTP-binding protein [Pseudonocardiaceae bacterium]